LFANFRSKISIKWNKVEKANAAGPPGRAGSSSSSSSGSDSEMDLDGIDEDAPDLYRNSALGIIGGEVEDESEDEDDDEEDDMLDIYDENDMDMEDDDEADTEPSDEDDMDEDEDMDGDQEDWTDEDAEDEGMEREVILDTEDPLLDDEDDEDGDIPFPMEDDGEGAPVIPEGLEDYLDEMLGDEDDEGMMDGMDGMDDMDDMDGMDGPGEFELEDEDEEYVHPIEPANTRLLLDEMEEAGDAEITIHPPSATAGHWGWATDPRAARQDRPRSRLMMGELKGSEFS
jgi:E3 ubiquitin-protein ligase HUWE1